MHCVIPSSYNMDATSIDSDLYDKHMMMKPHDNPNHITDSFV